MPKNTVSSNRQAIPVNPVDLTGASIVPTGIPPAIAKPTQSSRTPIIFVRVFDTNGNPVFG